MRTMVFRRPDGGCEDHDCLGVTCDIFLTHMTLEDDNVDLKSKLTLVAESVRWNRKHIFNHLTSFYFLLCSSTVYAWLTAFFLSYLLFVVIMSVTTKYRKGGSIYNMIVLHICIIPLYQFIFTIFLQYQRYFWILHGWRHIVDN